MTPAEAKLATDYAWSLYRARSQAIPPLPWDRFLERDEQLWRAYRTAEDSLRKEIAK